MNVFDAIQAGDEDALRERLEVRPEEAGVRDEDGLSPVLQALYLGHSDLVDVLLDTNPPLDVFDSAATGRIRGLEALLEGEPELARGYSPDGFTALHLAAYFGRQDAAEMLLDRGADVGAVARKPELTVQPLHSAAAGGHAEIVELLLERGADASATQGGGATPLHAAAQNGDERSVEALLACRRRPVGQRRGGPNAGDLARAAGHDELAEKLTAPS